MLARIAFIILLTSCFIACDVMAEDGPARHTVRVKLKAQPEFILNAGPNGEPERSNVDSVVTMTPPAIAKAVKKWTGIADRGKAITVKFNHVPDISRFVAMSSGDTGSVFASVKVRGKLPANEETHVRYKAALAASDAKTFSVLGVFEFENRVTRRKCYVTCHIEGEKPASKDGKDSVIHPTGTATWTGPIINASSVLFSENDTDVRKR